MGLIEQLEVKPEYLILGALGVGVVLFMAANRQPQTGQPEKVATTNVTPATDTVDAGTVQQWIDQSRSNEQDWIINTLNNYYSQYNGQPPSPDPNYNNIWNPQQGLCPDGYGLNNIGQCIQVVSGGVDDAGRGGDTQAFYRWPNATAVGGDSPAAVEPFTGRRWTTFGLRSAASGY